MDKTFEIYIRTTPERLWEANTHGEIRSKRNQPRAQNGFLRYPLGNETGAPDRVGRYDHLRAGPSTRVPSLGHEVHGDIRGQWAELGWETSIPRLPLLGRDRHCWPVSVEGGAGHELEGGRGGEGLDEQQRREDQQLHRRRLERSSAAEQHPDEGPGQGDQTDGACLVQSGEQSECGVVTNDEQPGVAIGQPKGQGGLDFSSTVLEPFESAATRFLQSPA